MTSNHSKPDSTAPDSTPPDSTAPQFPSIRTWISRFLGGAMLGALVLLIPMTYGTLTDIHLAQGVGAGLLIGLFGLLSAVWGETFIDNIMRLLSNTGL
ncbi:hypothetical protein [Lyngbya confervoides]|uniref:Uncharacterized protein n=1 Tax=Lyngbya confervoides BDU141951 TaxID=1574623 RepID=A0ABD4SZS0_9CYAN|nr:hypothetical protein [Lyngbya confervoides]MCM1981703.1 hypothetical protein [Lyngbya confervoides BDU141951]